MIVINITLIRHTPPTILRSILKSPRPTLTSYEEIDGEILELGHGDNSVRNRLKSPTSAAKNKATMSHRRKSFLGSLFGTDLGQGDHNFVQIATETALDFLYPYRKLNKR